MKIKLDKVMPKPLESIKHSEKSIWGNVIELIPQKKIMLNASSGKGKSTFATTVFGLRNDYTGSISYDGIDIKTLSVDDWTDIRKSKLSVAFQDLQLFPKLSVRENLLLKNSLTDTYSEQELKHHLQLLEIEDKWEQKCGLLSMGQQQRVAIFRSLAQPFDWLIMDEPFSHLDEENTQRCLRLIDTRTNELNAGFVLTSLGDNHNFNFDQELNL